MGVKQFLMDLRFNIMFVLRCLCVALILGSICGVVGALFHISVDYVTELRERYSWIVYGFPLGGLLIVFLYYNTKSLDYEPGTNTIIQSVRQTRKSSGFTCTCHFLATVITHLVGGIEVVERVLHYKLVVL